MQFELNKIHNVDARVLLGAMESGSVDLIVTDPPYHKEYIPLYEMLAEGAKHALKPGGLLLALCGHHSMDEIIVNMRQHLTWYWVGGMPNSAGSVGRYHPRQMMCGWKPCLWFVNGIADEHDYTFDWLQTRVDKRFHEWGQPVGWFKYYIEKLSKADDLICDPFMGGGTIAIACEDSGRRWIGAEIDETTCQRANKRLEQWRAQGVLDFDGQRYDKANCI